MDFEQIIYEPGKVARIIFNRPKYLNAQSYQMLAEFDRALAAAVEDPQCGAIVLSGAGRAFCAGHDLGTEEEIRYCSEHKLTVPHDGNLPKKVADMHVWFVRKTLEWRN
jgi:enoyl-CoA hydratase/carnithine racemase